MQNPVVSIDTKLIKDWPSFHDVFSKVFGFPAFYGHNMDAWIDCMSSLNTPEDGMCKIKVPPGNVVVLQLENAKDFSIRCPEQYSSLIDCSAFVNYRLVIDGEEPVLALAFYK